MGFVKGFALGVSSVVLGVIGVATVCAIRDSRKEEKAGLMLEKEFLKKQEQREKEEAEILQAAKDSYDREIGAVFEKIKKKFSA